MTDGRPEFTGLPSNPAAREGDGGTYTLVRTDGSLTLDVSCVRVDAAGWAESAGLATIATPPYVQGEAWLVSVKDGGKPRGKGDEIGMKSHGTLESDPAALDKGCYAALNDNQFGRQGVILRGNKGDIVVS